MVIESKLQDTEQQIFTIEYSTVARLQNGSDKTIPSRKIQTILGFAALKTGWLKQFGSDRQGRAAFLVLVGLSLHARPLIGEDFQLFKDAGLVNDGDLGSLYCRITDKGLEAELGIGRKTIGRAIEWMANEKIIKVIPLTDTDIQQDSRGQFAGTEVYLLSQDTPLQNVYAPTEQSSTVGDNCPRSDAVTVGDNCPRSDAVTVGDNYPRSAVTVGDNCPRSIVTVGDNRPHRGQLSPTKKYTTTTITITEGQAGDFASLSENAQKIAETWQLLTGEALTSAELDSLLELVGPRPKIPTSVLLSQIALLAGHDHKLTVNTLIGVVTNVIPVEQVLPGLGNQPDSAAPPADSPPYLTAPGAAIHDVPVQMTLPEDDVDPVLGQIATWYTSEIGPITAMVADDLRDHVQQYPDMERWEMAFRKSAAIGTGLKRWRYIMAVVGGDDDKYQEQKRRRQKQAAGTGQRSGSARSRGSSTKRPQRGHRQLTQAEIDALNTAAAERLAATAEATG
jgi:hypothetical protein